MPALPPSEADAAEALLPLLSPAAVATDPALLASPFAASLRRVEARGAPSPAGVLRALCARLLAERSPEIDAQPYPPAVRELIRKAFARIEQETASADDDHFAFRSHRLRSNLRILCFARVPVGPEDLEIDGLPRSTAWQGGPRQACAFARTVIEARGWRPFFVVHLGYAVELASAAFLLAYSPRAQERMFRNLAGCLEMHPCVRGVLAGSWWHDPQLDRFAPHLRHLRTGWTERGARLFRCAPNPRAAMLAAHNSPARQRAIASGEYTPIEHMVVWSRSSLLAWARHS